MSQETCRRRNCNATGGVLPARFGVGPLDKPNWAKRSRRLRPRLNGRRAAMALKTTIYVRATRVRDRNHHGSRYCRRASPRRRSPIGLADTSTPVSFGAPAIVAIRAIVDLHAALGPLALTLRGGA